MIGKSVFVAIFRRFHILGFLRRMRGKLRLARRIWRCRRNYDRVLHRIRSKPGNEKIRVLFLCSDTAKWKCQSVYERMTTSGMFEPCVGITALGEQSTMTDEKLEKVFSDAEVFFNNRGDRHVRVCDLYPLRYHDLSKFKPDIVFFPEPWGMSENQNPECISRFALVCYVPYYAIAPFSQRHSLLEMHRFLFLYFTQCKWPLLFRLRNLNPLNHVYHAVFTGHPSLDALRTDNMASIPVGDNTGPVIYAPHFSFQIPERKDDMLHRSTFLETGEPILEYAKSHPEMKWVFKPHPKLRTHLVQTGVWSQFKTDNYYAEWEKIGTVCYDGDYAKHFLASRAMITDCSSFLIEYGVTGKPILHLRGRDGFSIIQKEMQHVLETYYQIYTESERKELFKLILEEGADPLRERRLAALKAAGLLSGNAAANIVRYLANKTSHLID